MLVMTRLGLIIFRSSVRLTRLCSVSALLAGATTLRIWIGLASMLAATNFHGILTFGLSWGMTPDPSMRVFSQEFPLPWRLVACKAPPSLCSKRKAQSLW